MLNKICQTKWWVHMGHGPKQKLPSELACPLAFQAANTKRWEQNQKQMKSHVSIIPKGFFLSLHFSLNSRMIFFISSSTAALEGAHTRTRFCLILALEFSSEWPFLWFYNLTHTRQTDRQTKDTDELYYRVFQFAPTSMYVREFPL